MSWVKELMQGFSSGAGEGAAKFVESIDNAFVGKRELEVRAREIQHEQYKLEQELLKGQIEVNKIEAQHPSIFVAGWRPFIGWVGGFALLYNYIIYNLICYGVELWAPAGTTCPPSLDLNELYPIILAMLGMGYFRSQDKKNNVDSKGVRLK